MNNAVLVLSPAGAGFLVSEVSLDEGDGGVATVGPGGEVSRVYKSLAEAAARNSRATTTAMRYPVDGVEAAAALVGAPPPTPRRPAAEPTVKDVAGSGLWALAKAALAPDAGDHLWALAKAALAPDAGDHLWALAKASVAPEEDAAARLEKAACEAWDALAGVSKEWREEDHPRGDGGRFGNGAGGPGPTRSAPVHREERRRQLSSVPTGALIDYHNELRRATGANRAARAPSTVTTRPEVLHRVLGLETQQGLVHGAPAPTAAARRADERQASRNAPPAARAAQAATAAATPPEARQAAAAAPPANPGAPTALDAAAALRSIEIAGTHYGPGVSQDMRAHLERAGLIDQSGAGHRLSTRGRDILDGGAQHDDTVARVAEATRGATPAAPPAGPTPTNAHLAADDQHLHAALGYFHGIVTGDRQVEPGAVDQATRARLVTAGIIQPRPDTGHQITEAGRRFAVQLPTPQHVGAATRAAETAHAAAASPARAAQDARAMIDGATDSLAVTRAEREGAAQRQANDAQSARAREQEARRARDAEAVRQAAARPGRTPDNPVPAGTPTRGLPNGAYVTRERRPEHATREVTPIPLRMVPTTEAGMRDAGVHVDTHVTAGLKAVFGEHMPHPESLQQVWGDEAGGMTVKFSSISASATRGGGTGGIATFQGAIKKDGRIIGSMTRNFTRDSNGRLTADHAFYKINYADDAGAGSGAKMLGQAVAAYKEMGVDKVTVHPAWVGPYAWASFGYDAKPAEIDRLRGLLVPFLTQHGIPRDRAQEHADNCRSLHHFADLDLHHSGDEAGPGKPGIAIHDDGHLTDISNRDGSKVEMDMHLGKKFLLTHKWSEGTIDLRNRSSPSYQRVKARLGLRD